MKASPEFTQKLKEWHSLSPQEARKAAFLFVRDVQYGDIGSRNPFDVLKAKKGACSGKHALLRLFLEGLGYEVQPYFAKHDFSKFPVHPWPQELQDFHTKTLTDYHDFLKVNIEGNWITIDAIFDKPLEAFGFPIGDWDGITEMHIPVHAEEVFPAIGDSEEHKKTLLAALPQQVQDDRKAFLKKLTEVLDAKRAA